MHVGKAAAELGEYLTRYLGTVQQKHEFAHTEVDRRSETGRGGVGRQLHLVDFYSIRYEMN